MMKTADVLHVLYLYSPNTRLIWEGQAYSPSELTAAIFDKGDEEERIFQGDALVFPDRIAVYIPAALHTPSQVRLYGPIHNRENRLLAVFEICQEPDQQDAAVHDGDIFDLLKGEQ